LVKASPNKKRQKMTPIVIKEIIARERITEGTSADALAIRFKVKPSEVYNVSKFYPLRELYHKIFGPTDDIDKVNNWVDQQIKHYNESHS
jgi:hypothetical protein